MSISVLPRTLEILLVEDSPGDARLIQEAFKESPLEKNIHVVEDGEMALAFLHRKGNFHDAPRPDFILTDLNLPRLNGLDMLSEIKQCPEFKRIPVFILSTSESEEDIIHSYSLQANCFFTKPVDLDQLIAIVQSIEHFWLSIVRLPEGTKH